MNATPIQIEQRILSIRSQKVIIDADLATLYGVPTKRLNEQVKRNRDRFPPDFMFALTVDEKNQVVANCDHLANLKFSRTVPFAFTEHGAIQAANVLGTPQAIQMGVYVVRSFVRLRQVLAADSLLAMRLNDLESRLSLLALQQKDLENQTSVQFKQVFEALRSLMAPPAPCPKRAIGFILPDEEKNKRQP